MISKQSSTIKYPTNYDIQVPSIRIILHLKGETKIAVTGLARKVSFDIDLGNSRNHHGFLFSARNHGTKPTDEMILWGTHCLYLFIFWFLGFPASV